MATEYKPAPEDLGVHAVSATRFFLGGGTARKV